jgi:hypothetical protein
MKTKKITVWRVVYSDNSVSTWKRTYEEAKNSLPKSFLCFIEEGEIEVLDKD